MKIKSLFIFTTNVFQILTSHNVNYELQIEIYGQ
jgi:hypothetical protein